MAKFTAAQIEEHAQKILEKFEDGWKWSDLFEIVPEIMEIVGDIREMSNEEKHESAVAIADYVIDNTDTPWLPDSLTDPILKKAVHYMIPVVYKAAQGKYEKILGPASEEAGE